MSRSRIVQAFAILPLCLWPGGEKWTSASEQQPVRIQVVDYPRPLAAAIRQLEMQFGYVVTYEDTRYVHPGDLVDVTEEIRRDRTSRTRVFGRKRGTIDFSFAPPSGPVADQMAAVLAALIDHVNRKAQFGEFRVDRGRDSYHVVPVGIRGKAGVMESYASPLDTPITLPAQDENALEMMFRLTDVISAFSGFKVGPGTMPTNRLLQTRVSVSAQGEIAREVLVRALRPIDRDFSWQLLCDVGAEGVCAVNIHTVRTHR